MNTLIQRIKKLVKKCIITPADYLVFRWLRAFMSLARRTNLKRWSSVATRIPHWDPRTIRIAELINPGSSLVDIGAGAQTMRTHVKGLVKYTPCDLFKNTPDTVVCNFNEGVYPVIDIRHDFCLSSGVLEYIRKPLPFLAFLKSAGDRVILTYNVRLENDSIVNRLACDWINHFTYEELLALLTESGFVVSQKIQHNEREWIFVLKDAAAPGAN